MFPGPSALAIGALALLGCEARGRRGDAGSPPAGQERDIAEAVVQPHGLAIDATHVYWGDGPTLRRAPRDGGAAEDVCRSEGWTIESIVATGDRLYFGANGDGVYRVTTAGRCERIATAADPRTLAVAGSTLFYWDGEVREVALDASGGAAASPRRDQSYVWPGGLVADAGGVYWHDGAQLWKRLPGGGAEPIGAAEDFRTELALDATHVYWTVTWAHAVFRVPRAGGTPEYVTEWTDGGGIAIDGDHLLVIEPNGELRAAAIDGSGSARLGDLVIAVTGANERTELVVAGRTLFVAADVVDYSRRIDPWKDDPGIPGEVRMASAPAYRGEVVRFDLPETPPLEPAPARLQLGVIHTEAGKPVSAETAVGWMRMTGDRLIGALRRGELPLHVVTEDPRRDEIVAAIRAELGDGVAVVVEPGRTSGASLLVEPDAYAALWRGAPSR